MVPRRRRISRIRPALRDMYRIFLTQGGNVSFHMCLTQRARVSSQGTQGKRVNVLWSGPLPPSLQYTTKPVCNRPGRRKLGQKHTKPAYCPVEIPSTIPKRTGGRILFPSRLEADRPIADKTRWKSLEYFPSARSNSSRVFSP